MNEAEKRLLARAAQWTDVASLSELTNEKLREISAREGVDFATALLYDRLTLAPRHAEFISWLRKGEPAPNHSGRDILVGILPAAFYEEAPRSGADGRLVREEAIRMGFKTETIPLLSMGSLGENSKILIEWLARRAGEQIILVSLCKGGADLKCALGSHHAAQLFRNVFGWINICGTLSGSPVAQWLLATKLRTFGAWMFFKSKRRSLKFLLEIIPGPAGQLSGPLTIPGSMRLISLAGFPLRQHLTNGFMRRCHRIISPLGPNDGGILLRQVCDLPGLIYPVWGADHYLRPETRARRLIASILEYLTRNSVTLHTCTREAPLQSREIPARHQTA